jgi:Ca2+-binding RTX toxin-like protein
MHDILRGEAGNDTLNGANGNDSVLGGDGTDNLRGGAGNDGLDGGSGNDTLRGETGNDNLFGGSGNDVMFGGTGNDVINGGTGTDTASYVGQNGFVSASLLTGVAQIISGGVVLEQDTLISVENLTAGNGGSQLTGNGLANVLTGGSSTDILIGNGGQDTLRGNGGNDVIAGGAQADVMSGGTGTERFVFGADALTGMDRITDFETGSGHPEIIDMRGLMDTTSFAGTTFAQALSQGFIQLIEVGSPALGNFGTHVMVDTNGGANGLVSMAFLENVDSSSLTASNFMI